MATTSGSNVLEGVDEIVIIDNGAYNIRIASVPYPATSSALSPSDVDIGVYPNFIARTRASSSRKSYVSSDIVTSLDEYGGLVLRQPHQKGMISDWAAQRLIWDHVFASHFGSDRPANKRWLQNKAVIITESYFGLDEVRQATDLMLFEQYGAHAMWRCDAASLAAWTDLYDSDLQQIRKQTPVGSRVTEDANGSSTEPPAAKRSRQSRNSVTSSKPRVAFASDGTTTSGKVLQRRPENVLVLDLSYSACHAVPVVRGTVQYAHAKRLDVGGKILTNLLKETLSFRQLDMMDEFWLVDHIRRRTSFVAASMGASHTRHLNPNQVISEMSKEAQSSVTAPCDWTFDQLLTLCKFGYRNRGNGSQGSAPDVTIQWKLPDYSPASSTAIESTEKANGMTQVQKEELRKYGTVVSGPIAGPRPISSGSLAEPPDSTEREYEAAYIARTSSALSIGTFSKSAKALPSAKGTDDHDEEEDSPQFLTLSNERFTVPEVLFAPSVVGLAQNGIPALVAEAIASFTQAKSGSALDSGDMLWANVLLIGGLANIPGLKRRLQHELRSLAPDDIPNIHIQTGTRKPQHQHADLTPVKAGIVLATAPAATVENDWLHSKWLSYAEWSQSSNPVALAKQRFGRS